MTVKMLVGLTIMVWTQFSNDSAQANCTHYSPKASETMNSTEPLIINESLIIEDIKKAYKALATQGNDPRAIALQFGTIDETSLNNNEVKPFNPDVQSILVFKDIVDFNFRPNSLISLSALQKEFGNYTTIPVTTSRKGRSTYSIRFKVDLNGENINIFVSRMSPDLTSEKIEVSEISIVN